MYLAGREEVKGQGAPDCVFSDFACATSLKRGMTPISRHTWLKNAHTCPKAVQTWPKAVQTWPKAVHIILAFAHTIPPTLLHFS